MDDDAPVRNKKELNPEDLGRLLVRLDPDSTPGGENYKQLQRGLAKFFECNRCPDSDAHVSEVVYRVAAKLGSQEIRDLVPYCIAIAKNIVKEVQKEKRRVSAIEDLPGSENDLPDSRDHEEDIVVKIDRERMIACLNRCIARLRPDEQKLVIEYYDTYEGEQIDWRRKLAKNAGLTMGALRTRMTRLREDLEPWVKQCFKSPRHVSGRSRSGV